MIPHIPQELVEAIVEEVHESSLTACALTTRTLLDPSQRRIFRCINFYTPDPVNNRFDFLCAILAKSTRLASYVRFAIVRLHPTQFHSMGRLLRACTRLQSLAICFTTQVAGLDLASLGIDLIDGLLSRIASASLDHLEIWGQTSLLMSVSLLHFAITSVRTLALRRIKIKPDAEIDSEEGQLIDRYRVSSSVRLEHLTVDLLGRASFSASFYRNFGFLEGLQKLTIVQWSDRFLPLLEATSQTLREFRVDLAAALWQGGMAQMHIVIYIYLIGI
jgi:hypothetical protein